MVGAKSVHPGGRARRARGWVFVHSPSYKRFLFREGSISVIGTVESVDNCHIGPVGRGARVCMTGGASLSGIPRVCGQNLLFARRPPSVHRSCPVIPRRSTASGDKNCHSEMADPSVREHRRSTRQSRPGEQSCGSGGPDPTGYDATLTLRSGRCAAPRSPLRAPRHLSQLPVSRGVTRRCSQSVGATSQLLPVSGGAAPFTAA